MMSTQDTKNILNKMLRGEQAHYEVKHYQRKRQMSCDWITAEVQGPSEQNQSAGSPGRRQESDSASCRGEAQASSMREKGSSQRESSVQTGRQTAFKLLCLDTFALRGVMLFLTGVSHCWNCELALTVDPPCQHVVHLQIHHQSIKKHKLQLY